MAEQPLNLQFVAVCVNHYILNSGPTTRARRNSLWGCYGLGHEGSIRLVEIIPFETNFRLAEQPLNLLFVVVCVITSTTTTAALTTRQDDVNSEYLLFAYQTVWVLKSKVFG